MKQTKTQTDFIKFRVSAEVKKEYQELAQKKGTTLSILLRQYLDKELQKLPISKHIKSIVK
jgi:histone H3/H4